LPFRIYSTSFLDPCFQLEIANDENVPPAGDTVGRRLPRDVRGAKKASSPSCNRTPLRMKIKKFDDVAKICESSVRYPSSTAHLSHSRQVASDACLMPIKTRLRAVVLNDKGAVTYRTVGPDSPWGAKHPPARIIPICDKLKETIPRNKAKEDYSSDESESEESGVVSDEDIKDDIKERHSQQKRRSVAPPPTRFKTITKLSPKKSRSIAQNSKQAKRKIETLEDFRRRLHTSEVPERMPCREEEAAEVEKFIRNAISHKGTSSAMYISGVPGTGKTATVVSVSE
ncbi:hypothetical protein COOONC_17680, partial [Cooperia oncophora]